MSYGGGWINFEYILIAHSNKYGLATIQATRLYANLTSGKEPAHGQRLKPSLPVPLLLSLYGYEIVGRHI